SRGSSKRWIKRSAESGWRLRVLRLRELLALLRLHFGLARERLLLARGLCDAGDLLADLRGAVLERLLQRVLLAAQQLGGFAAGLRDDFLGGAQRLHARLDHFLTVIDQGLCVHCTTPSDAFSSSGP